MQIKVVFRYRQITIPNNGSGLLGQSPSLITNGAFIINIHPIAGDIFEIAPKIADAAILYLNSGFCMREVTWRQIRENWCPHAFHPNLHNIDGQPWEHSSDILYRVHVPDSQLRFIYIFSNPNNSKGFTTLENLESSLIRSLNSLSDLNIKRISLIHIPFVTEKNLPTLKNNICSANLMVRTLQNWDLENPSVFSDAYLVDLSDGFRKQITF